MGFPVVSYDRACIDEAGKTLANSDSSVDGIVSAKELINDWRASHYYPISTIQAPLRYKAKAVDENAIIVQRLKKIQSIQRKLEYNGTLTNYLSDMQDIGGCRVILGTISSVNNLYTALKSSTWKHTLINEKDYIRKPKNTGYRGVHLIYEYYSKKNSSYNGMRVEIQIRTHLQHLWATAVETVGIFTNNELKSNKGNVDWLRFFALVSSLFAIEEKCKCIPHTPCSKDEIVEELKILDSRLNFSKTLGAIHSAVSIFDETRIKPNDIFLLTLGKGNENTNIISYKSKFKIEANKKYLELENVTGDKQTDVVLVSASSLDSLRKAYPNYFMDIGEFVFALQEHGVIEK